MLWLRYDSYLPFLTKQRLERFTNFNTRSVEICVVLFIAGQRQGIELGSRVLNYVKIVCCLVACESHQSVLTFVVTSIYIVDVKYANNLQVVILQIYK